MKTILFASALLLVGGISWARPSLEERYHKTRDGFIRQFDTSEIADQQGALDNLEKLLVEIIGPIKVAGFPEKGQINLETLQKELGFGMVDGLRFASGEETLVVTTRALLKYYFKDNDERPKDLKKLAKDSDFHRRVFDLPVCYFMEIPVRTPDGSKSVVHAFLDQETQSVDDITPKAVIVFMAKGERVFVVRYGLGDTFDQIPACKDIRDRFAAMTASGTAEDYDEKVAKDYEECLVENLRKESAFGPLKDQVRSIVDRLERAVPEGQAR